MRNAALLLVDFINDLDFPGGEKLAPRALRAARNTAALRGSKAMAKVPVIYANDNFGRWRSDFRQVIERCAASGFRSAQLVETIAPRPADHFVLKPRHSAFFNTPLDMLLEHLRVKRLVVTGLAADICVLFTANDAHLRGYRLWIPADCIAAQTAAIEREAVRYFVRVLKADVRPAGRTGRRR